MLVVGNHFLLLLVLEILEASGLVLLLRLDLHSDQ